MTADVLLAIVGTLLLTDYMTILNTYFISLTPDWLFKRL